MASVTALLAANDLPIADLSSLESSNFLYCGPIEQPSGIIGLQRFGTVGLLRSLVVRNTARSHGCGTALVEALEAKARQFGVENLYLLTETAEKFFAYLNYVTIPKDHAPPAIKSTREFDGLCSDDAILMHKYFKSTS